MRIVFFSLFPYFLLFESRCAGKVEHVEHTPEQRAIAALTVFCDISQFCAYFVVLRKEVGLYTSFHRHLIDPIKELVPIATVLRAFSKDLRRSVSAVSSVLNTICFYH
jgi:hypothetical protein